MSARTFDIIRTTVFFAVICILCSYIHRPYDDRVDATFFDYYRDRDTAMRNEVLRLSKTLIENETEISYIWAESESNGYLRPSKQAQKIDSAIISIRGLLSDQYISEKNVDSVQAEFENCITWMLGFVPLDSTVMRPFAWSRYSYNFYHDKQGRWLRTALFKEPAQRRELIFGALKIQLSSIQCMILKRKCELTVNRCCFCYDSVIMIHRPTTAIYNPGDKVAKDLILVAIPHYQYHAENYFNWRLLESGSYRTGKLIANCPAPGDYELNGFSRVRWYRGVWDTLPWSFKYRVIGKGASLLLGAHQYCYRYVPNPITVSIPGYPPGKIKLWAKHAKLVHKENARWEIFITDTAVDKIIVYADATDVHGHTATVHAAEYAIKDLDGLRLTIDGSEPTTMPAADILKGHSIQAIDRVSGFTLRVISYDLVIIN